MSDAQVAEKGMTLVDQVGLSITIVIFILMVIVYWYVARPKAKDMESAKYLPFDDDDRLDQNKGNNKN